MYVHTILLMCSHLRTSSYSFYSSNFSNHATSFCNPSSHLSLMEQCPCVYVPHEKNSTTVYVAFFFQSQIIFLFPLLSCHLNSHHISIKNIKFFNDCEFEYDLINLKYSQSHRSSFRVNNSEPLHQVILLKHAVLLFSL